MMIMVGMVAYAFGINIKRIIIDEFYPMDISNVVIGEDFGMNPDYRPCINYQTQDFVKDEKLKQSQMYKRSNQKHPAFNKRK